MTTAGCRGFIGPVPLPLSMSDSHCRDASQDVSTRSTIRTTHVSRQDGHVEWWQVRRIVNALNGATALGLVAAVLARARLTRGPRGLVLATEARVPVVRAAALTLGDVVLTRHDEAWLEARPRLLAHEERHAWQYVACLGLPLLPLYAVAAGWSWLRGGDPATYNPFERLAGLRDGGYPTLSARARRRSDA